MPAKIPLWLRRSYMSVIWAIFLPTILVSAAVVIPAMHGAEAAFRTLCNEYPDFVKYLFAIAKKDWKHD